MKVYNGLIPDGWFLCIYSFSSWNTGLLTVSTSRLGGGVVVKKFSEQLLY